MRDARYYLGIDIGSVSLKAVVCNGEGEIIFSSYRYTEAKPKKKVIETLREIEDALTTTEFSGVVFTGSGKSVFTETLQFPALNEIIAHAQGCWQHYPAVKSIIEIGGQDSKFISIDQGDDGTPYVENFQFNGLCSAGTGAFLDQQSGRLGLSIEEFAEAAYRADSVPVIAGRCSVFAKSDMIHLQQKGTGKGPIAAGLCYALARNYLATLCKGRLPKQPVAFQGGVSANKGMLRAFSDVLGIAEADIIVPPYHKHAGAYGAALHARGEAQPEPVRVSDLIDAINHIVAEHDSISPYPPLRKHTFSAAAPDSIYAPAEPGEKLYLGLDVGSVVTKGVLLTEAGKITASAAEATRSEPIQAAGRVLQRLGSAVKEKIGGFYSTGSGRYLILEVFGADNAVDEITAHSRSAAFFHPEADTIFEIGGQDSKFIRLEQGAVKNFIMNRLCAAGTGSFLEEQAGRLSIDIHNDFSRYAFQSKAPAALGSRCTVFMDSDLVHHIQKGEATEDLCAGLAFSIVENYLKNVTTSMDLGKQIVFQGGVANNEAVHAAFESHLRMPVALHPTPTYAGAVGAALIAVEEMAGKQSSFFGFQTSLSGYAIEYWTCEDCPNRCEIMTVTGSNGGEVRFGSICGKHNTSAAPGQTVTGKSPLSVYTRLLYSDYLKIRETESGRSLSPRPKKSRGSIALPSGLTLFEDYPFWSAFFQTLGFTVISTGESTEKIAKQGKEQLPVETCMPVRMLYGHALAAADMNTDYIFVPHTPADTPDSAEKPRYLCPYTQTAGYIIRKKIIGSTVILGKPREGEDKAWIHRAGSILGIPKGEIAAALQLARKSEELFRRACKTEGRKLLEELERSGGTGFVLLGRPYVACDAYLNMELADKISSFGVVPVPVDFLDIDNEEIGDFWEEVHWEMGRKLLQAASFTRRHSSLFPVILTSFGCGPDGFIVPFIEEILRDSPRLVLEFDENRIDTGLITRVEAYARSVKNRTAPADPDSNSHRLWRPERPLREYDCRIPYFSDHAYAYAGALRAAGCRAEVLPPTDEHSFELARKYASGNECHPFLTILGDLLRLAEDKNVPASPGQPDSRESIYYSPKYVGSCLINAYETSMQLALDKMGIHNVHLLDFGNMQLMKELGLIYPYYLAMSSYTIDRLTKWAFEITPYEAVPGSVMETHRRNMVLLNERMAEHKLMRGIKETTKRMHNVPLTDKPRRPAVGITGDVFTRINPAANFGLFEKLQKNGFDTLASALIMDVVLYRYEQLHKKLRDDGKFLAAFGARTLLPAISVLKARVDRHFPDNLRTPQESQFPDVYKRTKDLIDYRVDNLISLNLNRIYELHHAGAEGILNVMCPNCMIGTMSEAFFPDIKEEQKNLPITSLSFGDQQETHVDNRLEAFMHLVKEGRKKG
jgi:predicted CoA-substrate-specific enzyme activase